MKPILLGTAACLSLTAQVHFTKGEGTVEIQVNGQPFTTLYYGPETRKPYLHPLRSASARIVTRRYPMENVAGEARDHVHHRGLWFTHGDVNGIDFWANEASQDNGKKGRVVLRRLGKVENGARQGTIHAVFEWRDPNHAPILEESRLMVFHAAQDRRILDLDITLKAMQRAAFGDTKEGVLAIRLATELEEKHNGRIVSAEGRQTEQEVWGTRSRWVDYAGQLGGETMGVAILDHPSNPRHPTYWHARAYGLFAANIFGVRDFLRDKTQNGELVLEPGHTLRFRYRVIIHSGDAAAAQVEQEWRRFAEMRSSETSTP